MKIYANLVRRHGRLILEEYEAGKLKSKYEAVDANGDPVLLWTGSCQRLPKFASLLKRAKKAGLKRAVVICPPTREHIFTVTLERRKDKMQEVARQAYKILPGSLI